METIKITFCGAARVVTGSCYLLEHNNAKFLVDCGMFQGNKQLKERNYGDFPFNPREIDFVILTHAHIDHSGLLPKLYKSGFSGPTYGTSGTVELSKVMLPDSGHIQEMEVERKNRKIRRCGGKELVPIYTALDAEECTRYFQGVNYDQEFEPGDGIKVTMRDAGHILGSAMLEIKYFDQNKETKLVFTGDLGRSDRPIINDPAIINEADFLVMESTYGNRLHEEIGDNELTLAEAINQTFLRGGNVIIPAFAVDRTQDLLLTLNMMIEEKKIDPKSIYIDSPLAIAATEIFCRHPQYFDMETKEFMDDYGQCPFLLPNLNYSRTAEESKGLNQIRKGAIIISASGMADAGRIKHHLKHNLWRPECTVIFVGYQAEGTLGRRIADGEKKVKIHGEEIAVKAKIVMLEGYSAHADKNELIHWLEGFKKLPAKIFVTHGEEQASLNFAQLVKDRFQVDTMVPCIGESVKLAGMEAEGVCPVEASPTQSAVEIYDQINGRLQELLKGQSVDLLTRIRDYLQKLSA
ncbi:MAG: MBL fold metallo-hydrolase [Dehalobacterium sp.]